MAMIPMRPTGSNNKECICKQIIRIIYGYNGARNKVINMQDGVGGDKGKEHVCPDRLKSGSYADKKRMTKKFLCHRCAKFYQGVYIECPNCFKLQCQNCSFLFDWRLEYPANSPKPLQDGNCPRCGSLYNELLTITRIDPSHPKPLFRKKFLVVTPFKSSDDPDYKVEVELDVYRMVRCPPFDSHAEGVILRDFRQGNILAEMIKKQ